MSIKKLALLSLVILYGKISLAQTTHQQSYWIRLFVRGKIDEKWSWQAEADERRLIKPDRQLQFIAHSQLNRKLGKRVEITMGGTHSVLNELPEWRLYEELHFRAPISQRWRFASRFRTEQRWLGQPDKSRRYKNRIRGRLQLEYTFLKKGRIKGSNEVMWQAGAFDQNRAYLAVEWPFSKRVSLEIGYLKIKQKTNDSAYFDRDILRNTLYLNF